MFWVYCIMKEYDIVSKYYTPDTDFFAYAMGSCAMFLFTSTMVILGTHTTWQLHLCFISCLCANNHMNFKPRIKFYLLKLGVR